MFIILMLVWLRCEKIFVVGIVFEELFGCFLIIYIIIFDLMKNVVYNKYVFIIISVLVKNF